MFTISVKNSQSSTSGNCRVTKIIPFHSPATSRIPRLNSTEFFPRATSHPLVRAALPRFNCVALYLICGSLLMNIPDSVCVSSHPFSIQLPRGAIWNKYLTMTFSHPLKSLKDFPYFDRIQPICVCYLASASSVSLLTMLNVGSTFHQSWTFSWSPPCFRRWPMPLCRCLFWLECSSFHPLLPNLRKKISSIPNVGLNWGSSSGPWDQESKLYQLSQPRHPLLPFLCITISSSYRKA